MFALPTLIPELNTSGFADADIQVSGLRDDSRKVQQGDLFIAVSGENYSAQQMLEDIQESGAAAAIYDEFEQVDKTHLNKVPLFALPNLRQQRGQIASRFYGMPSKSMFLVGVTGTNGKTSCTHYLSSALTEHCGVIGTMGWGFPPDLKEPGLTTPDAIKLQELFSRLADEDASAVCIEASSHGLSQDRLSGLAIDTAVFTNLTRDHLDYHGSVEAYKAAKKKLFLDFPIKVAVVNSDDEFAEEILSNLNDGVEQIRFSLLDPRADVFCSSIKYSSNGIAGLIESPWGQIDLCTELIGDFNLSNVLAVVAVLGARGYDCEVIAKRVSELTNVKGRMDRIELVNGALAVIDYAHTPDALENALRALRIHCEGDLWCVMGCGGDRDAGKRPQMGEIAGRLADAVVVTDDNPRTESSVTIIGQILQGIATNNRIEAIASRRDAIQFALSSSKHGDIVLIAGKGHEDYQEINGEREEFSDHDEVRYKALTQVPDFRQIIVGLGVTGQSVVRYCAAHHLPFEVLEDNPKPQVVAELELVAGKMDVKTSGQLNLKRADRLILSPGVPSTHEVVAEARTVGAEISNDIQIFTDRCNQPIGLITGSNGKSTVTNYVGQLLQAAGVKAEVGGNIGIPVLDLLAKQADAFVLEVSSYQLEIADHCCAKVAVLLNLSPDHLDRYETLNDYYQAKINVFKGADVAVYPRDIGFNLELSDSTQEFTFGLDEPKPGHYGLREVDGLSYLAFGAENLVAVTDLMVKGEHDLLNIMAALAASETLGATRSSLLAGLGKLSRLEHRFEVLEDISKHLVINDSKSTNPASTLAALNGLLSEQRPIILMLGGLAKDADFSCLRDDIRNRVSRCFVYGLDKALIQAQLDCKVEMEETLSDCLTKLNIDSLDSAVILFSPGCASQDQFTDYVERGEAFKRQVRELIS